MKVRSRHNSNRRKRFYIVIITLLVIVIGMVVPRAMSFVSSVVMYPVHSTHVWLQESSSSIPVFFRDRLLLLDRIRELEDQVTIAKRSDVTQQRLYEENNRLRALLGLVDEGRVAAAVIARPNELPYDLLQIDRGSQHDIEVGAPVFVGQDIVIGLVVHVATNYSFVKLITSPGFEATAFVTGANVVARMEGFGGGVARVKVPQGVPLRVGDLVYIPSVEPGVFGRISHVESLPTQPEQYGYITPDIAISSLHQVAVGKQSQISHSPTEINENILEKMRTELLVDEIGDGIIVNDLPDSDYEEDVPEE